MFVGRAGGRMNMAVQVAFAIVGYAVAEDEIMHPTANIDGVDLNAAVIGKGSGYIRRRCIEQHRAPHEASGGDG